MNATVERASDLFTNGEFIPWLASKGHTPEEVGMTKGMGRTTDVYEGNMIYTPRGWVIIDP